MGTLLLHLMFVTTSSQFALPNGMLESLCFIESSHNINAVHHDDGGTDSLGICQVKLETAKFMGFKGTAKQLMDPKTNIYYAGKYLSHQLTRYRGSYTRAIIAYNIGSAKNLTATVYSNKVIKRWESNFYATDF